MDRAAAIDFFRELDSSGDGYVTKKEFRVAMKRLGLDLPPKDINILFAEFGGRSDGEISFDEIQAVLKGGLQGKAARETLKKA